MNTSHFRRVCSQYNPSSRLFEIPEPKPLHSAITSDGGAELACGQLEFPPAAGVDPQPYCVRLLEQGMNLAGATLEDLLTLSLIHI